MKDSGLTMRPLLAPAEIAQQVVAAGADKAARPASRAFVLAVLAGAFIAFGGAFMLVVRSDASLPFAASQVLGGFVFCLGLFLVLVAGAELFTGNNLMVAGVLSGRYSAGSLLRSWLTVYVGNAVGAICIALLVCLGGFLGLNDGAVGEIAFSVAAAKASLAPGAAFVRGILCNILVCLAVWMGFAGQSVADKLAAALLPVMGFVVLGFEHSIANWFFLPLGLIAQVSGAAGAGTAITLAGAASNLLLVTLGNIVGGCLVTVCYWFVYLRNK